ncbi:MAG: PEP-CTERM sorting domain-containing protein [Nitrosomonas sp.]
MNGMPLHLMLEDFVGSDAIAGNVYFDNIAVTAVPEPETYALLLAGLGLLGFATRYRRNSCEQA